MNETSEQKLDIIIGLLRHELGLLIEVMEENKQRLIEVRGIEAKNAAYLAKSSALVERQLARYAMDDSRSLIASLYPRKAISKAEEDPTSCC